MSSAWLLARLPRNLILKCSVTLLPSAKAFASQASNTKALIQLNITMFYSTVFAESQLGHLRSAYTTTWCFESWCRMALQFSAWVVCPYLTAFIQSGLSGSIRSKICTKVVPRIKTAPYHKATRHNRENNLHRTVKVHGSLNDTGLDLQYQSIKPLSAWANHRITSRTRCTLT